MATRNLTLGDVIDLVQLDEKQKDAFRLKYRDQLQMSTDVTTKQLDDLNANVASLQAADDLSELRAAMEKLFGTLEGKQGTGAKKKGKKERVSTPLSVPENKESAEAVSLRADIDKFMKKEGIAGNPAAMSILGEFVKKLNESPVSPDTITKIRSQLNVIMAQMDNFDVTSVADIQQRINNYTESREVKTPELNMLFFSALVHQMYHKLGFRVAFERGGVIKVTGKDAQGAADLTTTFMGKTDIVEWMKSGLIANTSQWMNYIQSYPSQSSATVDNYISTRQGQFTNSPQDQDFLSSAKAGGFDIPDKQPGTWKTRGKNIFSIATASQQAVKKWQETAYRTPMQKAGGKLMNFAELAYNVTKFGFAVATAWKGAKAIWKTIFGDEAAMKAAWGDFGKTAVYTGLVWKGGDVVRTLANDIKGNMDLPNYKEDIQGLSLNEHQAGIYDGWLDLWKQVGGGIQSGNFGLSDGMELLIGNGVPAHQFNEMFEVLCTGRKGEAFLNAPISDLVGALNNSYTTHSGSHVGGIREFFLDLGPWGKDVYDKFFIHEKTGDRARKFLLAISNYKSVESAPGAQDAVSRSANISQLFKDPPRKQVEMPENFSSDVDKIKASWTKAGYEVVHFGADVVAFGGDALHVIINGADRVINLPKEMWDSASPETREMLAATLTGLGVLGVGGLALSLIPGTGLWAISGKVAIAGAAGTAVYYLFDKVQGLLNSPDKLFDAILAMPLIPKEIKDLISQGRTAKKNVGDIVAGIQSSPLYAGLPQPIKNALDSLLAKLPGYVPASGNNGGANNPGGSNPNTPNNSPEKEKVLNGVIGELQAKNEAIPGGPIIVKYASQDIPHLTYKSLGDFVNGKKLVSKLDQITIVFPDPNNDVLLKKLQDALK